MKLFTPKFERDPRWQRDDWRSHHLEEAQVYLGVLALRDMIAEVTKEAVSRLAIVQGTPGDDSITGLKKKSDSSWSASVLNLQPARPF
jgi:hypothetical protein